MRGRGVLWMDTPVERVETGQQPEHLGYYEQPERNERPTVAKVEQEALDECASRHRGRAGVAQRVGREGHQYCDTRSVRSLNQ
jgi:hypothetical protein